MAVAGAADSASLAGGMRASFEVHPPSGSGAHRGEIECLS
jgi:hypothetical protein